MRSGASSLLGLALLVFGIAISSTLGSDTSLQSGKTIPPTLFGLNLFNLEWGVSWPTVSFVGWRSGKSVWSKVEPQPDHFDFGDLDHEFDLAREHGVSLLLLLQAPPTWASSRPKEPGCCGPKAPLGNKAKPQSIAQWENYVRTVAKRYKGRQVAYELWNEPDVERFYSGTPQDLVQMCRSAYKVIKEVDPSILVVSPSMSGGSKTAVPFLDAFLAAGGGDCVDVIGFHFYVAPQPPEAMLPKIDAVKAAMARYGVRKPIWDTEVGWNIINHDKNEPDQEVWAGKPLDDERSQAYLARTYLLSWAAGIERVYWYAWAHPSMGMTEYDRKTPKPIATSFSTLQKWLIGKRLQDCNAAQAVWTCTLQDGNQTEKIVWRESGAVGSLPKAASFRQAVQLNGSAVPLNAASSQKIGEMPVLLK
jgi:Glycosyl hydrolase catalytic core